MIQHVRMLLKECKPVVINEFINKIAPPHPNPLPPGERESIISPPLRGGEEGEGV